MTISQSQLDAFWMPFSANRDFKTAPRIIARAEGHYYTTHDGRKLYDAFSGLWTCGVGHCHPKIVSAIQQQATELDHFMAFQAGHGQVFQLAEKLTAKAPAGFNRAFFTNSGSESVDTALKMALGYHRSRGQSERTRLIGRERGYHGVNFGGMSVGGMGPNRQMFSSNLLPGVDHICHTHNLEKNAFSKGQPQWGAELANDLERLIALHGGNTIAAVIVEPVAGSTGILPPPTGYLERLRELCNKHGILLIFDEVITAFGRVGDNFAAQRFGVIPDMITTAKGLTNGAVPMGAVLVRDDIYDTFMQGPEHMIEFFHGYTYSGHPLATAAAMAALDIYDEEGIFQQARELEPLFEELLHGFSDHPTVVDVRNFGLMGAIELMPRTDVPGARGLDIHKSCFWDHDLVVRNGGDTLQFSPFLNAKAEDLVKTFETVRRVIDKVA